MRLFIAVDVPMPDLGEPLPERDRSPSHLTLLFIGEVSAAAIPDLTDRLRRAVAPFAPFPLELRRVGVFPPARRPRLMWVGVGEGAGALVDLHAALTDGAGPLAPREDRPFVPHLTVLRVRGPQDLERIQRLLPRNLTASFGTTIISEVLLKSSVLGREGATHEVVARFPLEGQPASEDGAADGVGG